MQMPRIGARWLHVPRWPCGCKRGPLAASFTEATALYESFLKWDFIGISRTEWPQGGMRPAALCPQLVERYPLAREGRFWETGTKAITNLYHNV